MCRRLLLRSAPTTLIVLLLLFWLVDSVDARVTRIRRSDVVATHTYLMAMREQARSDWPLVPAAEGDIRDLLAHVSSQCPNVLAGAPKTEVVGALALQTVEQVAKAYIEPMRTPTITFAKTVTRLRWSNRKLDYYIHGSAEEARANAELNVPDICEEARAVVADGYTRTPPMMARFEKELRAANSKVVIAAKTNKPPKETSGDLSEMIMALLRPYERPDDKKLIPPKPTTAQVEKLRETIFGPAEELARTLGLPIERELSGASDRRHH